LKRFRSRSAGEWVVFIQALCGVVLTRAALRVLPLPHVRRLVRRCFRAASPLPPARRASAGQAVWAALSAGRHSPLGTTCLTTALVAQALLQRHGYEAKLRIGVRRDPNGAFTAHAWLERDGIVIVGGPAEMVAAYAPMPEMEHLIA
jgi:Transglutaminase-like superfamily